MIFATDVQYADDTAFAAGIVFPDWKSDEIESVIVKHIDNTASYEPGYFYKRELPCILALLSDVEVELEAIIVDGYVTLGEDKKPGLGMHLYNRIDGAVPVIGIAKKEFTGTPNECRLLRGKSKNPLFVTSVGVSLEVAKGYIAHMHGDNRIPTLIKKVDQLCRGDLESKSCF